MDNQSPEFKALQAEWYKKIEKSGFEDVERENGQLTHSKDENYIYSLARGTLKARIVGDVAHYYVIAGQFLHDHAFKDDWNKQIWEMHSNGLSIREITTQIRSKKPGGCSKDYVQKVLKPLIAEMLRQNRESDE